jgi:hypothetical protein
MSNATNLEHVPSLMQDKGDTTFSDHKGTVHQEYTPQGQTVNKHFYFDVLACLHDAVHHKPRKRQPDAWKIQKNKVSAHLAQLMQQFLDKHHIPQLHQCPYTAEEMAPCDFFLFP